MTIDKDIRELTAEELDVVTGGTFFDHILDLSHRINQVIENVSDDSVKDLRDLAKGVR
jgi:hypothetical protein